MSIQKRFLSVAVAILGFSTLSAMADEDSARYGRIGCGGTFTSQSQQSTWDIRNFSDTLPITIDRMRIYDAMGGLRFDSQSSGGLPTSLNGVLGVGDRSLEPNQTVTYNTDSLQQQGILVLGIPVPLQLVIDWSATDKVANLAGSLTRISYSISNIYDSNTGTYNQVRGPELGRAIVVCRNLPVSR